MSARASLAPHVVGRTITDVVAPAGQERAPASPFAPSPAATWRVVFDDGATLAVRTDGTPPADADRARGARVSGVRQHGTALTLALVDAQGGTSTLAFRTAEEAGCVLARDADGRMTYAD